MEEYILDGLIKDLNKKYGLEYGKKEIFKMSLKDYLNHNNLNNGNLCLCESNEFNKKRKYNVTKQKTYKIANEDCSFLRKYFYDLIQSDNNFKQ